MSGSQRQQSGPAGAGDTLLDIEDLHAHYGKSHVLHGVSLRVASDEVVSLVGRNGSGRSTTMKTIMGLVPPTSGRIRLRGRDLAGARPYAICRAGIAYVPEEREIFANLTVDENLRMGEQSPVPGAHRWTIEQMFD
jgi:branched-chain amino acid transport system ATP-binding protein